MNSNILAENTRRSWVFCMLETEFSNEREGAGIPRQSVENLPNSSA